MEIFKCTLSKVEVLHSLHRHYMKIKEGQITRASTVTMLNIGRGVSYGYRTRMS